MEETEKAGVDDLAPIVTSSQPPASSQPHSSPPTTPLPSAVDPITPGKPDDRSNPGKQLHVEFAGDSPRRADEIKIVERERTVDREIIRYVPTHHPSAGDTATTTSGGYDGATGWLSPEAVREIIRSELREARQDTGVRAASEALSPSDEARPSATTKAALGTLERPAGWNNPFLLEPLPGKPSAGRKQRPQPHLRQQQQRFALNQPVVALRDPHVRSHTHISPSRPPSSRRLAQTRRQASPAKAVPTRSVQEPPFQQGSSMPKPSPESLRMPPRLGGAGAPHAAPAVLLSRGDRNEALRARSVALAARRLERENEARERRARLAKFVIV